MPTRLNALLFSVFLAASGATGVVLHICQSMGGVASGNCDCASESDHEGHGEHGAHAHHQAAQRLEAGPCCTVEISDAVPFIPAPEASALRIDQAPLAVVSPGDAVTPRSRTTCDLGLLRERAPPNIHGPPLFIRNCSFLN
jgi:hypothetical protein